MAADPRKTVEVDCPRCRRTRRARMGSRAHRQQRQVDTLGLEPRHAFALVCVSCRALLSIDQHQAAIAKLYTLVTKRRLRGL